MRSQSGILEVAIMTSPGDFSCAYNCYYCPDQPGMPRSYIKEEPAVKRAALNKKWAIEGRTAKQHKKWLAKEKGKGIQLPVYGRR